MFLQKGKDGKKQEKEDETMRRKCDRKEKKVQMEGFLMMIIQESMQKQAVTPSVSPYQASINAQIRTAGDKEREKDGFPLF